jgi:signal transduction histidine kinase
MSLGLRSRVLVPLLLALLFGGALHVITYANQRITAQKLNDLQKLQMVIDRAMFRISERHMRTMRRVNDALLDPSKENRLAILEFTGEHYVAEMDRLVVEATSTLNIATRDPLLLDDVGRITALLQGTQKQIQDVASAIDGLLEMLEPETNDDLRIAERDLNRVDRNLYAALRSLDNLVRRTVAQYTQRALTSNYPLPPWMWLTYAAFCGMAIFLVLVPLQRIRHFLLSDHLSDSYQAILPEEKRIVATLQDLQHHQENTEHRLTERLRETDRLQNQARRAEHELLLLRLYNEHLVDSLRSAIVVTDGTLNIVGSNRVAKTLLAIDHSMMGQSIEDHPLFAKLQARLKDPTDKLKEALANTQTLRFETLPYTGDHLLDVAITPYQDESGRARGLLWVVDDVTETIQTKNQLLVAERLAAVGRLSSQVAHEIRNPLSAIGLNAELLEDMLEGFSENKRAEATQLLRAIASEIERLTEITEGYLKLARLPHPQMRLTDVNQVIVDLIAMLAEDFRTHSIQVTLQLVSPGPVTYVDPGQLRQALLNILRNSREAMQQGGTLTLVSTLQEKEIQIGISDTGPGIPLDLRTRVFEPFFSTKPEGTGLGLSLTQQIIYEHGGRVDVGSASPHGAKIFIHLPLRGAA